MASQTMLIWTSGSVLLRSVINLQELEFFGLGSSRLPLPARGLLLASIFRFSPTLRVVHIRSCKLPDGTDQGLKFPLLKERKLYYVAISEYSLHNIILGCPALDSLVICDCCGFRCVRINSLSLRRIEVEPSPSWYLGHKEVRFEELVIENAPCLRRLLQVGYRDDILISVICSPKLEALSCKLEQDSSTKILFGSMVIQGLQVHDLTMVVRTVKILAVDMNPLSLDTVIYLMKCFPCLEKLYIRILATFGGPNNLWRRKHQKLLRCLDIRLKTIVLEYYRGIKTQVSFSTFFVLNARRLESMTLGIGREDNTKWFIADQHKKLLLENRASRDAQFHFTTGYCFPYSWFI